MTGVRAFFDRHAFVAAESRDVGRTPLRIVLCGVPIVLFRPNSGGIAALEDRCPHRGVPLSIGHVDSDTIVCRYHGWAFDAAGHCRAMPGTRDGQPLGTPRVTRLSVIEHQGLVWVSLTPEVLLPSRIKALQENECRFRWRATWNAPIIDVQENFLDALHTHTIHAGLVRRASARRPIQASVSVVDDGFHVDYTGQPSQSGLLYRLFESRRTLERAHVSGACVTQLEFAYAAGWAAWITLCCTPETKGTTRIYASLHVRGRWAPSWLVRALAWPLLARVADQDRDILERQQHARADFDGRPYITTPLDIVRPFLEATWNGRLAEMPARRETVLSI